MIEEEEDDPIRIIFDAPPSKYTFGSKKNPSLKIKKDLVSIKCINKFKKTTNENKCSTLTNNTFTKMCIRNDPSVSKSSNKKNSSPKKEKNFQNLNKRLHDEVKRALEQKNLSKIDLHRNKGLIGLTITRRIVKEFPNPANIEKDKEISGKKKFEDNIVSKKESKESNKVKESKKKIETTTDIKKKCSMKSEEKPVRSTVIRSTESTVPYKTIIDKKVSKHKPNAPLKSDGCKSKTASDQNKVIEPKEGKNSLLKILSVENMNYTTPLRSNVNLVPPMPMVKQIRSEGYNTYLTSPLKYMYSDNRNVQNPASQYFVRKPVCYSTYNRNYPTINRQASEYIIRLNKPPYMNYKEPVFLPNSYRARTPVKPFLSCDPRCQNKEKYQPNQIIRHFTNDINRPKIQFPNMVTSSESQPAVMETEKANTTSSNTYDTPVATKTEMLQELEKALLENSPEKNDLESKRKLDWSMQKPNIENDSIPHMSKSVTEHMTNQNKLASIFMSPSQSVVPIALQGYSPPILPIPSYQSVLSQVKSDNTSRNFEDFRNVISKRKPFKEHTASKKISLDEYKKRVFIKSSNNRNNKLESRTEVDFRRSFDRQLSNDTLDLGYDSDTTVKL